MSWRYKEVLFLSVTAFKIFKFGPDLETSFPSVYFSTPLVNGSFEQKKLEYVTFQSTNTSTNGLPTTL